MERGDYDTKNKPKMTTFKYEQEGQFFGIAKAQSKEYGTTTGKRCPVLNYTGNKIFTMDYYK